MQPVAVPKPPIATKPKEPQIEYILISAGWIRIELGSLQVAAAALVAPWLKSDVEQGDEQDLWFSCLSEGRQISGRASAIQAVKYNKQQ